MTVMILATITQEYVGMTVTVIVIVVMMMMEMVKMMMTMMMTTTMMMMMISVMAVMKRVLISHQNEINTRLRTKTRLMALNNA